MFFFFCSAAEIEENKSAKMASTNKVEKDEQNINNEFPAFSMASQTSDLNISLGSILSFSAEEDVANHRMDIGNEGNVEKNIHVIGSENGVAVDGDGDEDDESASVDEIVIKVNDEQEEEKVQNIFRQPSTTEYLSSMVHTRSPIGLLPQFASWSLMCIGHSSVYSHNSGLPEHSQSGFLSGTNFLLPWDVQVRLENASTWAQSYEKSRSRRKQQLVAKDNVDGQVLMLKIFVGCEYECPRGHRFFMSGPDKILRGGSGK